jgi:hypothetical protein
MSTDTGTNVKKLQSVVESFLRLPRNRQYVMWLIFNKDEEKLEQLIRSLCDRLSFGSISNNLKGRIANNILKKYGFFKSNNN